MRFFLFSLCLSLTCLGLGSVYLFAQTTDSATRPAKTPEPADTRGPSVGLPTPAMLARLRKSEFQTVENTDQQATLSLGELRQAQLAWRNAFKSIHVDFIYSLDRRIETPYDQRLKKTGGLVPADLSYAVSFAVKDEKMYETYQDLTRSTAARRVQRPKQNVQLQPRKQKPIVFKWAFNGKETKDYEEWAAVGEVRSGRNEGIIQHGLQYFTTVQIPHGPGAETEKKTDLYPPEALARPQEYTVLPKLDRVDGQLCHVVASDYHVMWLDAQHGCCVRRRAWLVRDSANEAPVIQFINIAKDFTEPAKGIWFPRLWYCLRFCDASMSPSQRGKLYSVDKIAVSSINVNNVRDNLFDINFPPGTKVADEVHKTQYIVPHGEELLEKAIAEGRPIVNGRVMSPGWRPRSLFWQCLWFANAVLILGIGAFLLVRFIRKARNAQLGNP